MRSKASDSSLRVLELLIARSDRPLPQLVATSLESVVLDRLPHSEWDNALLSGTLSADFDEPLLLTQIRIERATLVGASLAGSRLVDVVIDGATSPASTSTTPH